MLDWLTSQDVFEIRDEIEEVNRRMLEKLLDENDFVAVYFCKCGFKFAFSHSLGYTPPRRKSAQSVIWLCLGFNFLPADRVFTSSGAVSVCLTSNTRFRELGSE